MKSIIFGFLLVCSHAAVASADMYRAPRVLAVQMDGVEVEATIDKVVLESFKHGYWLYENECQTKRVRHPMLYGPTQFNLNQKKYVGIDNLSQSGWGIDGQLVYRRFFSEIQYESTTDCLDYYSGHEKIKGIRVSFRSVDGTDEVALSWSVGSEIVMLSRFDFEKNEHVVVAIGRVLSWYD